MLYVRTHTDRKYFVAFIIRYRKYFEYLIFGRNCASENFLIPKFSRTTVHHTLSCVCNVYVDMYIPYMAWLCTQSFCSPLSPSLFFHPLSSSLPPSLSNTLSSLNSQGVSDLSALCQIMCATFADHCPVYSKSAVPQQPTWGQQPVRPPATYTTPSPYGARPPYPQQYPQQPQYPG